MFTPRAAPRPEPASGAEQTQVVVCAPGRLHLGFLDPAGTLGRRFGSLGLVIEHFETMVELALTKTDRITAADRHAEAEIARVATYLQTLRERTGLRQGVHIHLARLLPAHAGLGSGTQLALAIGRGFARLHGLDLRAELLAQWLGRGLRSGIGVAGFERGGLLLDAGPGATGQVAPPLARLDFPSRWRIVLALDHRQPGLSGTGETSAFATLQPLDREGAADICHQVLMRVLPGAADEDFAAFASGLTRVQQLLGLHFAPAQGGGPFTSEPVGRLMDWMARNGGAAIGQSSWGPTGFAMLPSAALAEELLHAASLQSLVPPDLELRIVQARNTGASIHEQRLPTPSRAGRR